MGAFNKSVRVVGLILGAGVLASLGSACLTEIQPDDMSEDAHGVEPIGEAAQSVCLGSYDQVIADARALIAQNCGSISACGSGDTTIHTDIKLASANYCACYTYMWQNRNSYPWNALQVIYHEPGACSWNHIHLKKMSTCGKIHFNLDEGYDKGTGQSNDGDCYDDEPNNKVDKYFCSSGSRKGTCDNGGGGQCSCANGSTYWGTPVPAQDTSCGFRVCGGDNQLYECTSSGWVAQGGSPCNCYCPNGSDYLGNPINPNYTYCGYTVCGGDFQKYECTSSGWVAKGTACP